MFAITVISQTVAIVAVVAAICAVAAGEQDRRYIRRVRANRSTVPYGDGDMGAWVVGGRNYSFAEARDATVADMVANTADAIARIRVAWADPFVCDECDGNGGGVGTDECPNCGATA